jgi:hypothetical protein
MNWDNMVYEAKTMALVLAGQAGGESLMWWFTIAIMLFGFYLERLDSKQDTNDADL